MILERQASMYCEELRSLHTTKMGLTYIGSPRVVEPLTRIKEIPVARTVPHYSDLEHGLQHLPREWSTP